MCIRDRIIDVGLAKEDYAIAVKKGNTELLESINKTIKRMKEDGTYKKLTDAFMPSDGKIVIPKAKLTEGSKTLKMGTNAAFKPFEYVDGTEPVGFDISLSQEKMCIRDRSSSLKGCSRFSRAEKW